MAALASSFATMVAASDMPSPMVADEARRPNSWVMSRTLTNGSGTAEAFSEPLPIP